MRRVALAALGLFAMTFTAIAADWPQFRGPAGNGDAGSEALPIELGKDKNVRWKVAVPGAGWSSPVVVGDKVFVTTAVTDKQTKPQPFGGGFGKGGFQPGGKGGFTPKGNGFTPGGKVGFSGGKGGGRAPDALYKWQVLCLDAATGKELWKTTAVEKKHTIPTHSTNTYASETPIVDGDRLYAYFGMTGVYCFDLTGKQLWSKDLGSFPMQNGWGTGSSPAADAERLFILCDNEQKSFLVALDKKDGKELWRVDRRGRSSWSTPFLWKTKDRSEVVCCGDGKVISYEPATGKVIWEMGGIDGTFNSSPTADPYMIYFGTSGGFSPGPIFAVKAGAKGHITLPRGKTSSEFVAWTKTSGGPRMPSPLLYQGHLYVVGSRGGLTCYDAATGKEIYSERLPRARGFTSSPWAADGKVYVVDEGGRTFAVKAGKEFELLGEGTIDEMTWSTPAAAGGAVFLRGRDHLFCFAEKN